MTTYALGEDVVRVDEESARSETESVRDGPECDKDAQPNAEEDEAKEEEEEEEVDDDEEEEEEDDEDDEPDEEEAEEEEGEDDEEEAEDEEEAPTTETFKIFGGGSATVGGVTWAFDKCKVAYDAGGKAMAVSVCAPHRSAFDEVMRGGDIVVTHQNDAKRIRVE